MKISHISQFSYWLDVLAGGVWSLVQVHLTRCYLYIIMIMIIVIIIWLVFWCGFPGYSNSQQDHLASAHSLALSILIHVFFILQLWNLFFCHFLHAFHCLFVVLAFLLCLYPMFVPSNIQMLVSARIMFLLFTSFQFDLFFTCMQPWFVCHTGFHC